MTIREIIEARAREAAGEIADRIFTGPASIIGSYQSPLISDIIRSAIIAILTDPQVGFKEALEWQAGHNEDMDSDVQWAKAVAAEAKLAELKELEKVK